MAHAKFLLQGFRAAISVWIEIIDQTHFKELKLDKRKNSLYHYPESKLGQFLNFEIEKKKKKI